MQTRILNCTSSSFYNESKSENQSSLARNYIGLWVSIFGFCFCINKSSVWRFSLESFTVESAMIGNNLAPSGIFCRHNRSTHAACMLLRCISRLNLGDVTDFQIKTYMTVSNFLLQCKPMLLLLI